MKLVIGGRGAGKREFVKSTYGYSDCDISSDILCDCDVLYNLQNAENLSTPETFEKLLKFKIIICDEVGCGIVPMEELARVRREEIGKICTMLACKADAVVRVYCGIATAIKGEI